MIKCLYVDPHGKLWICDEGSYSVNTETHEIKNQTSGLSVYDNGKWEVFGMANNYYRASSYNDKYNEPAYWIRKDKHGLYRVLTTSTMRVFGDDHILQKIKWADILKNSTLVRQKSFRTDSANNVQLNEVLTRLVEADTYSYPDNIISTGFNGLCTSKFYYTDNDELVMLSTYGVLVVSPKGYLPVEGESNESIAVYPNPAHDYIYIPNAEDGSSSVIIDVFGREIKQSREGEKQISISDLPSGTYFIRFTNKTKSTKYTKFVKL